MTEHADVPLEPKNCTYPVDILTLVRRSWAGSSCEHAQFRRVPMLTSANATYTRGAYASFLLSGDMPSRVWVITGTSTGLGLATAVHALRQGDKVRYYHRLYALLLSVSAASGRRDRSLLIQVSEGAGGAWCETARPGPLCRG